jgi:DNA adenine methylase
VATPFLKWVGGKGSLLPVLTEVLPEEINGYYEPFTGGGALFFHLASSGRIKSAHLNDWNSELTNAYRTVRDKPKELLQALDHHLAQPWNTAAYFESMRSQDPEQLGAVERAARLIYLNKTSFNGLYRTNRKGQFNAPFGKYSNPSLYDLHNFWACSRALQDYANEIFTGDFNIVRNAVPGDVVYLDPPYVAVSATANFASYTSAGFTLEDQQRLAKLYRELAERDVTVVLSNSDTEVVRSLYEGFEIRSVKMTRAINSKAANRGHVGEVLVIYTSSTAPPRPPSLLEQIELLTDD